MMAVDLHTRDSQFLPDKLDDALSNHNTPHHVGSHISSLHTQNHHSFDFQDIASRDFEMSWDLADSPQSTLWSKQGSPEGSSLEPTPPHTPGEGKGPCLETTDDVVGMFEKMKLHETEHSKYLHAYGNQSFNHSNIRPRPCSNQQLIDQQIRAVQFSRLKQEQFLKPKNTAYRESEAQIPQQIHPKEQIQKKGNGRSLPLSSWKAHQPGSGMRAVFLGSRSGSCGTGVFLPRGTSSPSDSRKKPGCSTVLIPARVVQALQLHFEQMAKAGGLPPLNDVLVSNNDGMYSLQKQESRKEPQPANIHKDMMLPPEWTY